jgi:hypothetical protein
VAKHAVHIGWAIDSNDWRFPDAPDPVFNSVSGLLKTAGEGSWGVMLMHAINPQTVVAPAQDHRLHPQPRLRLRDHRDVVRARYGKSSGELILAPTSAPAPA